MAQLLTLPFARATNASGVILPGAKLRFYLTGTTNLTDVYTTSALSVAHANPVIADAGGLFPAIYLNPTTAYRAKLFTSADVAVPGMDFDPVNDVSGTTYDPGFTGDVATTFEAEIRRLGVSPEQAGAAADGVADDEAEFQTALDALASGGGMLRLTPGKTYKLTGGVKVNGDDITIDARGATITSPTTASEPLVWLAGDRCKIIGGKWMLTGNSVVPWVLEVQGADCSADGMWLEKSPETGGYHAYVRSDADRFEMTRFDLRGSNGIFIAASGCVFDTFCAIARTGGGDDLFALKAIGHEVSDTTISNGFISGHGACVSIGSEVGLEPTNGVGVNDATRSSVVRNVNASNLVCRDCSIIIFIKPGGISVYDYRDGLVEGVTLDNIRLVDINGTRFQRGIVITPARGAMVRNIKARNIEIIARNATTSRAVACLDCWNLDYRAYTIAFTSGGPYTPVVGDAVVGATSGALATVGHVTLTSGSWAAGTAAGTFLLFGQSGTFVAENLNVAGNLDVATIAGNSTAGTTNAPSITDVDVAVTFNDPDNGVTNILTGGGTSAVLATQTRTTTNVAHTLSFIGTGTVTLSGTSTAGPLVGTGATNRVSLAFTPTAGSLTLTVSGDVRYAALVIGTNATSAAGLPSQNLVRVENQATSHGTIERVVLDIDGNGTSEAGIYVGATLGAFSYPVELKRVRQLNINTTDAAQGGIYSLSTIKVGEIVSALVGSTVQPVGALGLTSPRYYTTVERVRVTGVAAGAGLLLDVTVFKPDRAAYISRVEIIPDTAITQNETNYLTIDLYNTAAAATIASRTSRASDGANFTAFTTTPLHSTTSIGAAAAFNVLVDTPLRLRATGTNAGQIVPNMLVVIHYVLHGR